MLKLWKQAWQKSDSANDSNTRKPSDDERTDAHAGLSADSSVAASQSVVVSTASADRVGTVRKLEPPVDDRPLKRRKTDHASSVSAPTVLDLQAIYKQCLRGNVIAVTGTDVKLTLLGHILQQSCESERRRSTSQQRTALLVVDDDLAIGRYVTALGKSDDHLSIASYALPIHGATISSWSALIAYDVVVVSANLLRDCLIDGSITLSDAHLLIISDAQRILSNRTPHPMLRIMEFYRNLDIASKPKALTMVTCSQADRHYLDVSKLEALEAKTVFVEEESAGGDVWERPMELVIPYSPHNVLDEETPLSLKLREIDTQQLLFLPRHYRRARQVLAELGSFAADLYWRRTVNQILDTMPTSSSSSLSCITLMAMVDVKLKAQAVIDSESFSKPALDERSQERGLSPQLVKLIQTLETCEPRGANFRALVIVRKRAVAIVMAELLEILVPFIHAGSVTGHGRLGIPEYQQEILRKFSERHLNLLVVTKSSEDLDFIPASIVVRFNVFDSQVSYAFSSAHADGAQSHLIHMVESDNDIHQRILTQVITPNTSLQSWIAQVSADVCSAVPPGILHEDLDPYRSDSDEDDESDPFIKDPTTSARLYKTEATTVMYRILAGSVDEDDTERGQPLFKFAEVTQEPDGPSLFACTVLFPKSLDVSAVTGPACASLAEARRAACYLALSELHDRGLLDCRQFPQPRWSQDATNRTIAIEGEGPSSEPEVTAKASAKTHCYPRKRPDFWTNSLSYSQSRLYPTVVIPSNLKDEHHAPVLILTRRALPELPSFPVFDSGSRATVRFIRGAPFEADGDQLHALYGYTTRICRAVINKPFECPMEDMFYFFAPLRESWTGPSDHWHLPSIVDDIPWDIVKLAVEQPVVPLVSDAGITEDSVRDVIVQDRSVEFTNRHFVVALRRDLTPLSKADDSPREAEYANFVEYCRARRKGFEGLKDYEQPLIQISAVPMVINNLHPTSKPATPSSKPPAKYLIPELCFKFTVPASTFRTMLLMPSITSKIDDLLLVKQVNAKFFQHIIEEDYLLAALSPPAAWVEHDYERLELLGDAYLKDVSSIYCYVTKPTENEGALHAARQKIISNKALFSCATRIGLPSFIQGKRFVAKLWQPAIPTPEDKDTKAADMENAEESQAQASTADQDKGGAKRPKRKRQQEDQNVLWLGEKTVADVVEAIIGAAYLSGGCEVALEVSKILGVGIPDVALWSDFGRKLGAIPPVASVACSVRTLAAVETIVGRSFTKVDLLVQALSHTSILKGNPAAGYDRLEFVGDAILDFLVIRHVFHRYPQMSPGGLSMLKAAMVSKYALAALCVHIGLHEHIRHASPDLEKSIRAYAENLRVQQDNEFKLAAIENRLPGQYWMELEPPKILSDVVESVVGALYVSDDFSPAGVEAFFENVVKPFYERHVRFQTLAKHPNTTLLELLQAEGCQQHSIRKYADRQTAKTQADVVVHDVVLASAVDPSTATAIRKASILALDALEGTSDFLARTCDCRVTMPGKKSQKKQRKQTDEEPDDAMIVESLVGDGGEEESG